jgi:3D (Asp-Asp-Asp) domain-containing protein
MIRWKACLALGSLAGLLFCSALFAVGTTIQLFRSWQAFHAVEYRVQTLKTQPPLLKRGSQRLAKGWVVVLNPGQAEGWRCLVRQSHWEFWRGSEAQTSLVRRLRRVGKSRPMEVLVGKGDHENPIGVPKVSQCARQVQVEATAYDPGPVDPERGWVGNTSLGLRARFGIIAVDPRVIPYRSLMYVEGYGVGYAGDTGGAIKGKRIDLCYNTTREAFAWGRRRTNVYLLKAVPKKAAAELLASLALPPAPTKTSLGGRRPVSATGMLASSGQ